MIITTTKLLVIIFSSGGAIIVKLIAVDIVITVVVIVGIIWKVIDHAEMFTFFSSLDDIRIHPKIFFFS